ncbi:hypothetical protein RIF29_20536 [Crotalaria pallida]|uniref:Uncharacterized protein n=1 Tax=Crotalaria pallida TaxID=3830 RepID=A0AAN9F198_CROPI
MRVERLLREVTGGWWLGVDGGRVALKVGLERELDRIWMEVYKLWVYIASTDRMVQASGEAGSQGKEKVDSAPSASQLVRLQDDCVNNSVDKGLSYSVPEDDMG